MRKVYFYIAIALSVIVFWIFTGIIFHFIFDFQKSVEITADFIQTVVIIVGALWAYRKFGWEKKCENIIALKAALMDFSFQHNMSAAQYRKDNDIVAYKVRLLNPYNQLQRKIHLSYYVSKELRDKIFQTIWLTIGNVHGKNLEKLDENWKKFEKQRQEIFTEFESIISV